MERYDVKSNSSHSCISEAPSKLEYKRKILNHQNSDTEKSNIQCMFIIDADEKYSEENGDAISNSYAEDIDFIFGANGETKKTDNKMSSESNSGVYTDD